MYKLVLVHIHRHPDRNEVDVWAHFNREIWIVENAHRIFLGGDNEFLRTLQLVENLDNVFNVAKAFVASVSSEIISSSIYISTGKGVGRKDLYSASPLKFVMYSPALCILNTFLIKNINYILAHLFWFVKLIQNKHYSYFYLSP